MHYGGDVAKKLDLALSVDHENRSDLDAFVRQADAGASITESRSLDGITLATVLVTVGVGTVNALRDWLISLVDAKKGCIVSFKGVTLQGYSSDDVERLMRLIERELDDPRDFDSPSPQ
jgi:hypothetical protein